MKTQITRITLAALALLISIGLISGTALADGGYYHESGGCDGTGLLVLLGIVCALGLIALIVHFVRYHTSPTYKKWWDEEQARIKAEEERRRQGH